MSRLLKSMLLMCVMLIGASAVAMAGVDEVKIFASKLADEALVITKNTEQPKAEKQKALESLFQSHVDIPWVGRFVLGKYWRTATPQQQQTYLKNYEAFILKTYTSKITDAKGGDYVIKQVRPDQTEGDYVLTMELKTQGEPSVMMDYRIRENKDGRKIFDIIVEGVSMITTQRAEFGSVINNKGLDFLIEALGKKAASASVK